MQLKDGTTKRINKMNTIDLKAKRPLIIAGPCSAETEEQTIETCKQIAATGLVDVLRAG